MENDRTNMYKVSRISVAKDNFHKWGKQMQGF